MREECLLQAKVSMLMQISIRGSNKLSSSSDKSLKSLMASFASQPSKISKICKNLFKKCKLSKIFKQLQSQLFYLFIYSKILIRIRIQEANASQTFHVDPFLDANHYVRVNCYRCRRIAVIGAVQLRPEDAVYKSRGCFSHRPLRNNPAWTQVRLKLVLLYLSMGGGSQIKRESKPHRSVIWGLH